MTTLLLYCQDPYDSLLPPWSAYACFDYPVGRHLSVLFNMPFGRLETLAIAYDSGGVVVTQGMRIPIDNWEDLCSNFLRLRGPLDRLYAATAAEGLSRMAPLLETIGIRMEVTECLLKNL